MRYKLLALCIAGSALAVYADIAPSPKYCCGSGLVLLIACAIAAALLARK